MPDATSACTAHSKSPHPEVGRNLAVQARPRPACSTNEAQHGQRHCLIPCTAASSPAPRESQARVTEGERLAHISRPFSSLGDLNPRSLSCKDARVSFGQHPAPPRHRGAWVWLAARTCGGSSHHYSRTDPMYARISLTAHGLQHMMRSDMGTNRCPWGGILLKRARWEGKTERLE